MLHSALTILALAMTGAWSLSEQARGEKPCIKMGQFGQEVAEHFGKESALSEDAKWLVTMDSDRIAAMVGTEKGISFVPENDEIVLKGLPIDPILHKTEKDEIYATGGGALFKLGPDDQFEKLPAPVPEQLAIEAVSQGESILIGTAKGVFRLQEDAFVPLEDLNAILGEDKEVRAIVSGPKIAVAAAEGLFCSGDAAGGADWRRLYPSAGGRSWAPNDIRGVAWDIKGRLWFASPQGIGCMDADGNWTLYTGDDGVPYDDFTCVAAAPDGMVWFGTTKGAVCFDGTHWGYRQGRRWLPDDHVRAISISARGVWFATKKGVSLIKRVPMTLAEKAKYYEDEIDKYHRRTEYEYVIEATLKKAGDKSTAHLLDSDNDGLWTSMYGAGECFAYGATKDPLAQKRAKQAFEALRFLGVVTQGGDPPAAPGFVARSIRSTDGPNPNEWEYTKEKDLTHKQRRDSQWKVMAPRWPTSADGKWYWKCDTSSDELDGHYFFYGAYYDLVADTDAEKQRVREVVAAITDHLIANDFCLVDWDGQRTRWAVFGPDALNKNPVWFAERGLNSLSILSYLCAAAHITGDAKYTEAFRRLVDDHGYAQNITVPKHQTGPGSGNQSDDEMAFMSFYNLMRYCTDPTVRAIGAFSFHGYWELEQPELNPFFNFAYAGTCLGAKFSDQYDVLDLDPSGPWLEQSVDTLKRFPLDRVGWAHENSHRKDIIPLPAHRRPGESVKGKGCRRNGLVIPVDETHFGHYNYDPWALDLTHHSGRELGDGAVFLLPYYMGLYHGFIVEEAK